MNVYIVNLVRLKRRFNVLLTCLAFLLVFTVLFSAIGGYFDKRSLAAGAKPEEQVIIIDAGHGGEDVGATGVTGVFEKDLNLEISKLLGEELKARGFTVVYTREEDRLLYKEEENIKGMRKIYDLKNRCKVADEYENAIFVSIHMNTFGASKYSGLQVYYADSDNKSISLAGQIQKAVKNNVQPDNNRQTKNGKGLYILDNCNATTVLVECGFLSNPEECEKLSQKEYQKQLSFAIVCGIIEYINVAHT